MQYTLHISEKKNLQKFTMTHKVYCTFLNVLSTTITLGSEMELYGPLDSSYVIVEYERTPIFISSIDDKCLIIMQTWSSSQSTPHTCSPSWGTTVAGAPCHLYIVYILTSNTE